MLFIITQGAQIIHKGMTIISIIKPNYSNYRGRRLDFLLPLKRRWFWISSMVSMEAMVTVGLRKRPASASADGDDNSGARAYLGRGRCAFSGRRK